MTVKKLTSLIVNSAYMRLIAPSPSSLPVLAPNQGGCLGGCECLDCLILMKMHTALTHLRYTIVDF